MLASMKTDNLSEKGKVMKQYFRKVMIVIFTIMMTIANLNIAPIQAVELDNADRNKIITEAEKHLGKPYVWGATGPDSFDCSGYTQYVFKNSIGINLQRTAEQQRVQLIKEGKEINKNDKSQWQPGDLIFFGNYGEAEHVAIWYGNDKIIHALSDRVRIDKYNQLIDKNGQSYQIMTVIKTVEDLGGFSILKVDENDKPLKGATFKITYPDGNTIQRTSGSDGRVVLDQLKPAKYKIKEVSAPSGKLLDDTVKTIDVKSGWNPQEHVYKFVNNSPTGEITLTKYNSDKSEVIPNTTYHVTSKDGYDAMHTTDSRGKITLENLKLSTYTFVEVQSADGFLLDKTPIIVELKYKDQHTAVIYQSVETTNSEPTGEITLTKYNEDKTSVIPNTTFHVTSKDGYDAMHTTNSKGKITLENMKLSTYTFVEVQSANGFLLDKTPITVELKYKDQHTSVIYQSVEVTNVEPTGKIILTKYNSDKSATIPNTQYRITGKKGYDKIHTTNSEGKLVVENLKLDDYTIVEQKSAEGYLINKTPIHLSLKYKDQTTSVIVGTAEQINDEPTATIHLKKDDKETGSTPQGDATLEGAVYQLFAGEDIYNKAHTKKFYSKGDVVATRITDKNGNMESVKGLPLGHFQLKEETESEGYLVDKEVHDIHCDYEGQEVNVVVRDVISHEQVKKQAFEIIKVSTDSSGETELLAGAEFTVKLKSEVDQVGWEKARTYNVLTTDKKGYAKSIELPYGNWLVRETKIPNNVMPVEDFVVTVNEDSRELQTWRVLNDEPFKALVKAIKVDKETGKTVLLPDTTFKIKNLDTGEYVGQWVWFPVPHYVTEFKTDASGTVTTPNTLSPARYQLEEIQAPFNYVLDEEPIQFEISSNTAYELADDGKTPIITVTKEDVSVKGVIEVSKLGEQLVSTEKDEKGNIQFIYENLPVDGAKFIIETNEDVYSADNQKDLIYRKGEKVAELTTKNGFARTQQIPLGKYKIYEQIAGESFVINKEVKEIELTYQDQYTTVVVENTEYENQRQKVYLDLTKVDRETNTPLSGAEFGLYAVEDIYSVDQKLLVKTGTLIESVMSNVNGKIEFKIDLPINSKFEIKELKAPIGFASTDEIIDIDTSYQGQELSTIEINKTIQNEIIKVEVSKKDATTDKELPGAHLVLKEKDGQVFESWISTNEPHLVKGLEPNKTYELIETSCPHGFALSQKVEFTVKDIGEIQKVEMKDDLVIGQLKWQKIGEAFHHTVIGQTEFGTTHSPVWTKQNLVGASITIYAAEDITLGNGVTYYHKDEAIQTLESEWKEVPSQPLLVGKYYYVESSSLHGYITDTQNHFFEIKDSQSTEIQIIESTLENKRPTVEVQFKKIMEEMKYHESNEPWKDVVFGIYAREDIYSYMGEVAIHAGELIDTTGINEKGQFNQFPDLPNGLYFVKELQTNPMFNLDEKEYNFEIAWHGGDVSNYKITIGNEEGILNELQRGKIIIHKTDLDTREAMANVRFTIATDKEFKNIVQTATTDIHGYVDFKDLELGVYFIKEDSVDGYVINDHIYEVEIQKDGDELTINVENKPLEMEFSKVDITNNKELVGARMRVTEKETGKVIDEWISGNEPHKIKYLVKGKEYILSELVAPKNYKLAESITFKAEDGLKITMKDELKPKTPNTGDDTNLIPYIVAIIVSLGVLVVIYLKNKKDED